ncbi:MAG: NAD(P)-dependent glycerol-3-phosphate dehydrogenase [Lachnospiraceae bacterium]|nr:NAD(P)-dependent glycerol-3-phosphate dehydrogenase [Ruminococcus sp.]MCM1274969.1 NAD(P)-dependent glycerol-3-phosphate dehydrogenase [Lachnospiraceae bacterium]
MAKIAILGCGYGTALGVLYTKYGHEVTTWTKFDREAEQLRTEREHKRLLPGVKLPDALGVTTDPSCVSGADIVAVCIPSAFYRDAVRSVKPYITKSTVLVNASKGLEEATGKRLSELLREELPENPVAVITGPCHAEEIARFVPTTEVCAAYDPDAARYIQTTLSNECYRIYVNDDVAGCELGGVLKNPIALGCGIARGMGLGDNTVAALMTRGMTEITRLGVALGANWKTFTGMAGIGDLIVTCTSQHSRNYRAGYLIGQGVPAAEAVNRVGTVEGYLNGKTAFRLARERGIDTPIIEQIVNVCYNGSDPRGSINALMTRESKHEREVFWFDE